MDNAKQVELTWEEIRGQPRGYIFHDEFRDGVRFIILRGPCSLCAYIGVPSGHPLDGFDYDEMPINSVHGGLTFSGDILGDHKYYWYGWDYGHCNDYAFYCDEHPGMSFATGVKWNIGAVIRDSDDAIEDFIELSRLAERIARKMGIKAD